MADKGKEPRGKKEDVDDNEGELRQDVGERRKRGRKPNVKTGDAKLQGKILLKIREFLGKTQEEFAEIIDCNPYTLSNYERATSKNILSDKKIEQICKNLMNEEIRNLLLKKNFNEQITSEFFNSSNSIYKLEKCSNKFNRLNIEEKKSENDLKFSYKLCNIEQYFTSDLIKLTKQFLDELCAIDRLNNKNSYIIYYSYSNNFKFSPNFKNKIETSIECFAGKNFINYSVIEMRDLYLLEEMMSFSNTEYLKKCLLLKDDTEYVYWCSEFDYMQEQVSKEIDKIDETFKSTGNLIVILLVPQPLALMLGILLQKFKRINIYQPHRKPFGWAWPTSDIRTEYLVQQPESLGNILVLNLSLGSLIDRSEIEEILGENLSIWTLTIDKPDDDFLKSKKQLFDFIQNFTDIMSRITQGAQDDKPLHVFMSVPIAIAFEIGRNWDLEKYPEMTLYGKSRKNNSFIVVHTFRKTS